MIFFFFSKDQSTLKVWQIIIVSAFVGQNNRNPIHKVEELDFAECHDMFEERFCFE